jgi:hypothetical protein
MVVFLDRVVACTIVGHKIGPSPVRTAVLVAAVEHVGVEEEGIAWVEDGCKDAELFCEVFDALWICASLVTYPNVGHSSRFVGSRDELESILISYD